MTHQIDGSAMVLVGLALVGLILAVALVWVLWSVFTGQPAPKSEDDDIIEAEFSAHDVDTYA